MLGRTRRQAGITLIELMIAMLIGLIALSAVISLYAGTARHTRLQLSQAHLRQQMQGMLQLVSNDLRRAGYWRFDPRDRPVTDNPFQHAANILRVDAYPGEAPSSCILFAYDLDNDGQVGVGRCDGECRDMHDDDNVEQFGFRLRGGRVQFRYGGDVLDCRSGYWQAVTDPDVEVIRLEFIDHGNCINLELPQEPCAEGIPGLYRHAVEIHLSARLRSDRQAGLDFHHWVTIRNNTLAGTHDATP